MNILFVAKDNFRINFQAMVAKHLSSQVSIKATALYVPYITKNEIGNGHIEYYQFNEIFTGPDHVFPKVTSKLDDNEIQRIETHYGNQPLWNLLFTERQLIPHTHSVEYGSTNYTRNEILNYFIILVSLFEKIFNTYQIDTVIDHGWHDIFRIAIEIVATKRAINYFHITPSRLYDFKEEKNRWHLGKKRVDDCLELKNEYRRLKDSDEDISEGYAYLKYFRNDAQSIYKLSNNSIKNSKPSDENIRKKLLLASNKAKGFLKPILFTFMKSQPKEGYNFRKQIQLQGLDRYRWEFIKSLRKYFSSQVFVDHIPYNRIKYALFTLHVQPEASTSELAPFHVNQLGVIENVARCLPLDWVLVVKQNKTMESIDPIWFQQKLKQIPNVLLASANENTKELINYSQAIISITGTSGMEAALLGKKVIQLVPTVPWIILDNVRVVNDWNNLYQVLKEENEKEVTEESIATYLQAIINTSFTMPKGFHPSNIKSLNKLSEQDLDEGAKIMSQQVLKRVGYLKSKIS